MTRPSPQRYARIAGILYLLNIAAGIFGEVVVRARLVVPGDSAATAHNLLVHQLLFRCGIAGDLFMHLTDVPGIVIFYLLLRPVSPDLSLLAACFNLVQTPMLVANKVLLLSAMALITRSQSPVALSTEQLQELGANALALHEQGFGVGLIFFGVTCLLTAYLVIRSGYLPRWVGVLQGIAGFCYLLDSFSLILDPSFAEKLVPWILLPAFLGELGTALWLLLGHVDLARWNERLEQGPVFPSLVP